MKPFSSMIFNVLCYKHNFLFGFSLLLNSLSRPSASLSSSITVRHYMLSQCIMGEMVGSVAVLKYVC